MVRVYKRKIGTRSYKNYTEEQLNEAIQKVADGELSMKAAAARYKIPFGTIHNKFHGKHIKNTGGQPIFSNAEEMAIINAAAKCSDWGFPLDLLDIRMLAKSYLDRRGRVVTKFLNNIPGKDWALSLLQRHKNDVAQRVASNINKSRAGVSREILEKYFDNLEVTLEGVAASNIFNYDETNVGDDPGKKRCIYRRGVKYPEKVINHSKSCTSIMICGSADGTLLPPYVIYKSEHLYNTWKEGGVQGKPCCDKSCCKRGCRFNRTSHGWIDSSTFQDWFESSFLPHARRLEGRKVLIGDNLASHFNDRVLQLCEENNIGFVCLVPHSTHICQPLDVAFFKPLKVAWRAVLTDYKLKYKTSGLPKDVFPSLLKLAIAKMDKVKAQSSTKPGDQEESAINRNMINGFYATGIHPLNRHKVMEKIPDAAQDPVREVNDSLTDLLRENRFGQKSERRVRKKKRLNIEPGKSVATHESSSSEDEEAGRALSYNENDEEQVEDQTMSEGDELQEVEYLHPQKDLLVEGAFVLVKFVTGKRRSITYKYVCKVQVQFSETEYTVLGLKSVDPEKSVFKLVPKDISTVPFSDIIAILPTPRNGDDDSIFDFEQKVDVYEVLQ